MKRKISAVEARRKLGHILDLAQTDEIVITRAKKPVAVLISVETYQQFLRQKHKDFSVLDQIWSKVPIHSDSEIRSDVEQTISEVRNRCANRA